MSRDEVLAELGRLYDLTARLRRECPWDQKQTQESIIQYTVEETTSWSTPSATGRRGATGRCAASWATSSSRSSSWPSWPRSRGEYDLGDVARGIHDKLVRRHPHIFGEAKADTPEQVRENWEVIKRDSEGREGIFHDIPEAFPAVLLAQKLQQRAAAVGFDWEQAADVLAKIKEETAEVEEEMSRGDGGDQGRHASARAGRRSRRPAVRRGQSGAQAQGRPGACAARSRRVRFRERVEGAARAAEADGQAFAELALDEQEEYYQQAKKEQKQ